MTKAIYIGVSNKARKVKKIYVGVSNKARLVKKGYIGIGGKARLFFSNEQSVIRNGNGTALTNTVNQIASVSDFNGRAIFAGGFKNFTSATVNTIDSYNASLTKQTVLTLSQARANIASAVIGNYAIFAGGYQKSTVDTLTNKFVRSTTTGVNNTGASYMGGASNGIYAYFAGGLNGTSTYLKTITGYNSNLVRMTKLNLSVARYGMASISAPSMYLAVFACGQIAANSATNVINYINSRNILGSVNGGAIVQFPAGGLAGNNMIIAGGFAGNGSSTYIAFSYNASFVRTTCNNLQYSRGYLSCTSLGDYCIFAGGAGNKTINKNQLAYVDIYNSSLVHSVGTNLGTARAQLGAATVGNYAIFAGGCTTSVTVATNVTDIYKLG